MSNQNCEGLNKAAFALGEFGTEAEYNHLGWGGLVYPHTTLGLRPTFRIGLGMGGHAGGFFASPYPGLATYNQNGFDWLMGSPQVGSVVYVGDADPVNIICSVPYLVSAPVALTPVYPNNVTRAEWAAAGFDPDRQSTSWMLADGREISLIVNLTGQGFRLINHGTGAALGDSIPNAVSPFTEGLAIDPGQDFIQVRHLFAWLPIQEQLLPPGRYHFRIDLAVIPREFAYQSSNHCPVVDWFRNVNLSQLQSYPTASINVIGDMPVNLPIPQIINMTPLSGVPGDVVEFTGTLLGRTQEVSFSPDARSVFQVVSDNLVRATVSMLAETGVVVLETARGFVATSN